MNEEERKREEHETIMYFPYDAKFAETTHYIMNKLPIYDLLVKLGYASTHFICSVVSELVVNKRLTPDIVYWLYFIFDGGIMCKMTFKLEHKKVEDALPLIFVGSLRDIDIELLKWHCVMSLFMDKKLAKLSLDTINKILNRMKVCGPSHVEAARKRMSWKNNVYNDIKYPKMYKEYLKQW